VKYLKKIIAALKTHYDKVVAFVVLLLLLSSLLYLAVQVGLIKGKQETFQKDIDSIPIAHEHVVNVDVAPFEEARGEIAKPFQIDTSSWTNEGWKPVFAVEQRVWCAECKLPIPFADEICPFCRGTQPEEEKESADRDLDQDGMKDLWEIAHGLPDDRNNANEDSDGDGFTDMEEYTSETDPSDPKVSPPIESKIHLVRIAAQPFGLRFKSSSTMSDGTKRFALNLKRRGRAPRTYFKKLGDVVEGFILAGYEHKTVMRKKDGWTEPREVDVSVLTLKRGKKEIPLIMDVDVQHNEFRALLSCEISKTPIPWLAPDDTFDLLDKKYQLISIDSPKQSVVIKRLLDAKLIEFKRYRAIVQPQG
jgi:hypothetical protein